MMRTAIASSRMISSAVPAVKETTKFALVINHKTAQARAPKCHDSLSNSPKS